MQRCSALLPIRIRRLLGHEVGGDGLDPAGGRVLSTAKNWTDETIVQHRNLLRWLVTRQNAATWSVPWGQNWTKELISSSCDGVRSGSRKRPVAPSFVCACGADHVTTSRLRVRPITAYSLSRQTAYPCSRPPAHRPRVAPHPISSIPSSCAPPTSDGCR